MRGSADSHPESMGLRAARRFDRSTLSALGWEHVAAVVLVAAGVGLRLREYAAERSLQADEALIGLNVIERDLVSILEPLDNNQAAPAGFLELTKSLAYALGHDPLVLRLLPLVAGTAAVVAYWFLARRLLGLRPAIVSLAFFALSSPLIFYSSIIKPYALDVAFAVGLYLAALPLLRGSRTGYVAVGVLGVLAPFFSFASYFVLVAIGGALVLRAVVADRAALRKTAALVVVWAASLGASYAITSSAVENVQSSLSGGSSQERENRPETAEPNPLVEKLSDAGYLVGLSDALDGEALLPKADLGGGLTTTELIVVLFAGMAGVGFLLLARREPYVALALASPAVLVVVANGLGRYPLFSRVLLFLLPAAFIFVGEAAGAALRALASPTRLRFAGAVGVASLVVLASPFAVAAAKGLVDPHDEWGMKPTVAFLAEHSRPGDSLYLFWVSQYAVRYYADCDCSADGAALEERWRFQRLPASARQRAAVVGTDRPDVVVGDFKGFSGGPYLDEIEDLPSRPRVWVFFNELASAERDVLIEALDARGQRLLEYEPPNSETQAHLYLYDLDEGPQS